MEDAIWCPAISSEAWLLAIGTSVKIGKMGNETAAAVPAAVIRQLYDVRELGNARVNFV